MQESVVADVLNQEPPTVTGPSRQQRRTLLSDRCPKPMMRVDKEPCTQRALNRQSADAGWWEQSYRLIATMTRIDAGCWSTRLLWQALMFANEHRSGADEPSQLDR